MGVATWPQRYRLQQREQRSVGGSMAWGTATGIDDQATDTTDRPRMKLACQEDTTVYPQTATSYTSTSTVRSAHDRPCYTRGKII